MNARLIYLLIFVAASVGLVFLLWNPSQTQPTEPVAASNEPTRHKYHNLFHRYNAPIWILMIGCMLLGAYLSIIGNILLGIFPILIAAMFTRGFKQPTPSPRKVWLITCFGKKTNVAVDGFTLLLDWLPLKVIDKVEFNMERTDKTFKLDKKIKCKDGYASGELSTTIMPDERDDPRPATCDPSRRCKTGPEKLSDFDDSGGTKDINRVFDQIDDLLTAWVQYFARNQTVSWLELHGLELAALLKPRIEGVVSKEEFQTQMRNHFRNDDDMAACLDDLNRQQLNDARGLGIHFFKFTANFRADDEVIKACNQVQIENAQRVSQELNTETMNRKIQARLRLHRRGVKDRTTGVVYRDPDDKQPSFRDIRNDILIEDLADQEKVTAVINPGGVNVTEVRQPRT